MPCVSEFYGISICFYFEDHAPPHFHAYYQEHEAQIDIQTFRVTKGALPSRAVRLVKEWGELHREELLRAWRQASIPTTVDPIDPLP